jgi:hypothetical protein
MSRDFKEAFSVLPLSQPVKRTLSKARVAVLAKGYRAKGKEPKNNGVPKSIGRRMIRAAAGGKSSTNRT